MSVLDLPSPMLAAAPALLYAATLTIVSLVGALHPDPKRRRDAHEVLALLLLRRPNNRRRRNPPRGDRRTPRKRPNRS
jgi:hypothetical protein